MAVEAPGVEPGKRGLISPAPQLAAPTAILLYHENKHRSIPPSLKASEDKKAMAGKRRVRF